VKLRFVIAIAAAAVLGFAATAGAQDKALIEKGAKVYAAATPKCSVCHSIAGVGKATAKLDGVGSKLTADDIRQWMTDPKAAAAKHKSTAKPPMPTAYAKMSKEDLDALVAYLSSLKK
jgi:mono/diheme cytochrome c family protein